MVNDPGLTEQNTILDTFSTDCAQGRVIGRRTSSGAVRQGIDIERRMSIDHGALRMRPLVQPGWARQGVAYGPYRRHNGLAFAVFLLNGHNTSQSGSILQSLKIRCLNWALGLPSEGRARWRLLRRLIRWLGSGRLTNILDQVRCWAASTPERFHPPELNENLAVGWFPQQVPSDPLSAGNAFIVHATGPENGELWTRVGNQLQPAFRGLQNIQTYYIVILREQGAVYYAAGTPQAYGLAAYPNMRPVAIDPFSDDQTVYAGIYQSVLGQIGFRVDTRVYGVQVKALAGYTAWYGTAHAADALADKQRLDQSKAEIGGQWTVYCNLRHTGTEETASESLTTAASHPQISQDLEGSTVDRLVIDGSAIDGSAIDGSVIDQLAILDPGAPSGIVHALLQTTAVVVPVSLIWRFQDRSHFWSIQFDQQQCQLWQCSGGKQQIIATSSAPLQPHRRYSIQVLDDGNTFSLYLNGELLFQRWFQAADSPGTGVGIGSVGADFGMFSHFEAHPRQLPMPAELDLGAPWTQAGMRILVADKFEIPGELAGSKTSIGDQVWRKEMGKGVIEGIPEQAARVRASVLDPNPDRTVYTVAWSNPQLADIQVEITPPGTQRGEEEQGRAGLIFWQDRKNFIIINNWLNNDYGGASISSFLTLKGFEDLYDAVWTNVGDRIHWGVPHRLRAIFDGNHYTVSINDEPVLYRALTDVYPRMPALQINRVGIVANWEWGDDTGSQFRNFIAKG